MLPFLQNLKEFDLVYSVNLNTTGSFSLHPEIRNINCMFFFLDFSWNLLKVCLPEFHFFFSITRKMGMRQADLFSTLNLFVLSVTPFCLPRLIMGWTPQHDRPIYNPRKYVGSRERDRPRISK